MHLQTAFEVYQTVRIIAIEQPATILSIKFDGRRIMYSLEYWWNGETKNVWQYENEIVALNTKERDRESGVGPDGPSCIPTPRSQIDVLDNPPSAQARPASNTSQLAIAAQDVLDLCCGSHFTVPNFLSKLSALRLALQQQA